MLPLPLITGLFSSKSSWLIIGGIIIIPLLFKIWSMSSTINKLEKEVDVLNHNLTVMTNKNEILLKNEITLNEVINSNTETINKLTTDKEEYLNRYNKAMKEIDISNTRNIELNKLLKETQDKTTCEYGLELNKKINNLRYKDL